MPSSLRQGDRVVQELVETTGANQAADAMARAGLRGTPQQGLVMGTWGFFIGFAAVALYGPAAHSFQQSMQLSPLLVGLLVAAPQLTGSLLRIPFGAWVDKVGGRLPMLTLFGISIVGMWGLVFILLTVQHVTAALYPVILLFGFMSGCGVASFSVGIPQVSYWFPRNRQGTALGTFGGVGNLAPGIFTLALPFAIAALGLAGSYLAWLVFLMLGTAIYALARARRLLLPTARPRQRGRRGPPHRRSSAARNCSRAIRCGARWPWRPRKPAPGGSPSSISSRSAAFSR